MGSGASLDYQNEAANASAQKLEDFLRTVSTNDRERLTLALAAIQDVVDVPVSDASKAQDASAPGLPDSKQPSPDEGAQSEDEWKGKPWNCQKCYTTKNEEQACRKCGLKFNESPNKATNQVTAKAKPKPTPAELAKEDEARIKYLDLVPVAFRQTIMNHERVQPWDKKSWVERLEIAQELMVPINAEEAKKKASQVEAGLAALKDLTTKKDSGLMLNEAGVEKLTNLFFKKQVGFYIGATSYSIQCTEEEVGRGQYEQVPNFYASDKSITQDQFRADISSRDITGLEEAVGLLMLK